MANLKYCYDDFNIGDPKKYEGLKISKQCQILLSNDSEKFISFCNGVGSTIGFWSTLLWHLTPNTIWGLNITPASDLHDVGYNWPMVFNNKEEALMYKIEIDNNFYDNMMTLIQNDDSWWGVLSKQWRIIRATSYYETVKNFGEESFLDGKILINN